MKYTLFVALTFAVVGLQASFAQTGVVSLVSIVDLPGRGVTDVASYVDPDDSTEYAIVGFTGGINGIVIVDVSTPEMPEVVSTLEGPPGFDVKVFNDYVYTITGSGNPDNGPGSIIDISDPSQPTEVDTFRSFHNIFISDTGYLFGEGSFGLRIFDLSPDPLNPDSIFWDSTFSGHDATVIADRLYDFHGGDGTNIYDVSNPATPILLGSIDPPFISYHHSGWTSDDGNFLFINDELADHPAADVTIWDISDPSDPAQVGSISDPDATVHNVHIIGNLAFFSYYRAGFKVFDISDPANPQLAGEFDTDPLSGEGFSGAFGVDAFLPSGHILISGFSGNLGTLHVFSVDGFTTVGVDDNLIAAPTLNLDIFPNPSINHRTISFDGAGESSVKVFDILGREVYSRNLGFVTGRQSFEWDGPNLPAGTYFVKVRSGSMLQTVSIVASG